MRVLRVYRGTELLIQLPLDMEREAFMSISVVVYYELLCIFGHFFDIVNTVQEWVAQSGTTPSSTFLLRQMLDGECEYIVEGYTLCTKEVLASVPVEGREDILSRNIQFGELIC